VKGDVGLEIAVGVDPQLVAGERINTGFERGRVGIDVQHEHRPIAAAGRRKDNRSVMSVRGSGVSR